MARKTFVELIDDVDGSKAEETVSFSLDGVAYEIDLSDENAEKLRAEIGEWVTRARRVAGRRIRGTGSGSTSSSSNDSAKIRVWARENGREVSDRGRIPEELRQAYYAAN
ncbi:Lsr2 family protein [Brachybacterium halotolerans subsp. kimchii]|uniref:Lsr2 family protein n=1 Tax=Brachybacterium halotolerans TaxID=2795215 RepID=A0ABS1BE97_9MICO|nr:MULTISPECIES: Lsr2 family protein [Brachybacterium]MBK0332972.1 Lsr2 family protein [Brachybacterium halotolerans]MCG7309240.1 Lsr2 family protein [Brachybacterium sp. ACRRE]UEJ83477.1 Lsr2 family protein [Brachybacterium halotolerans subsp. kimchii]